MNKTVITIFSSEFEADIVAELLKANGIAAEISKNGNEYSILVSEIDKAAAEIIINNYNNEDNKKEVNKTANLKSSIIKMLLFIGGAVLFYYLISLVFKFTLKLF